MEGGEEVFKNIVSSLIESVLFVSRAGFILGGNPASEEMLGQSQDLFRGKRIERFVSNSTSALCKIMECSRLGVSFRDVECSIIRKSVRDSLPVSITISPYLDQQGVLQGSILLIRDLSLIKDLEETSRQKDQLIILGSMVLGLAHEIKNPLGGIRGSAQLLKEELQPLEQKEYLEVVVNETDRINRMLSQILNLAGSQKLKTKPTNLHKILEEIILIERKSFEERGCAFVSDYDPSLPPVEADEDRIKQVFINLVQNAIEASPKNKEIRIRTRIHKDYAVSGEGRSLILVEIMDQGPGISDDDQKKIFTPFFTTRKKGTGLGLAISLKVVEDHQGKIKVVSRPGQGTSVQVYIPVIQGSD